jgi:hypothetical protein
MVAMAACENAKPATAAGTTVAADSGTIASDVASDGVTPDTLGQTPGTRADTAGQSAGKPCTCGAAGVKLDPDKGCDSWKDKNECTAWHSVVMETNKEDGAEKKPYASGTKFCAFGCCIAIVSP